MVRGRGPRVDRGRMAPRPQRRTSSAPHALAILDGYSAGTRFGIGADPADGLLRAGVPGIQLTWMDAKIGEPRGHPSHRQAGRAASALGQRTGDRRALAGGQPLAGGLPAAPGTACWRSTQTRIRGGLIDVLDVDGVPGAIDRSIRPNQVLAAGGLPIPVLTPAAGRRRGRTSRSAICSRRWACARWRRATRPIRAATSGGSAANGTAHTTRARRGLGCSGRSWPPGSPEAAALRRRWRRAGRAFCRRCYAHLGVAGLGHVSEVVDGDAPAYAPAACPFQAWSLGELIRIEAMLGVAPHA